MTKQQPHKTTRDCALEGALPRTGVLALTSSAGPRTNPVGRRSAALTSRPVRALAELLEALPAGKEAWWSPNLWRGDRRAAKRWEQSFAVVLDLDYHDEAGRHARVPEDARRALDSARELPINIFHETPRGARLVIVLEHAVCEPELFERATAGAIEGIEAALCAAGLQAQPGRAGFEVDGAATDLARFFYTPRATVSGQRRQASVRMVREQPFAAESLAALAKPPLGGLPAAKRFGAGGLENHDAAQRWNEDHAQDWGPPGRGECPACGHRGCFGRLPEVPDRWSCFSSGADGHEARTQGGCGRRDNAGPWFGDALDLEAFRRQSTRARVLRDDGYLKSRSHQREGTS